MAEQVVFGAGTCVEQFSNKCQKLLFVYAGLTAVTLILDLVGFFRCIAAYSSTLWANAFADVSLLLLATVFVFLDLYYFAWAFSTMLKFPKQFAKLILFGLCGYFKPITDALAGQNKASSAPEAK